MPNQYVNKVAVNGETIIDLTADTVTASDVAVGKTFHLASGALETGTAEGGIISRRDEANTTGTTHVISGEEQEIVIEPLSVTSNGTYTAPSGTDGYSPVTVNVEPTLQNKTVNPSTSKQTIEADSNYDGLGTVTVNAMPSGSATTPATTITANPSISVSSAGFITATTSATKSVTPSISAGYVSSGTAGTITVSGSSTEQLSVKDSDDLTTSGATVTAPAGYYASNASKTIASGSVQVGSPTITASPTISVDSSGLITSSLNTTMGVSATVTSGYVTSSNVSNGTVTVRNSRTYQLNQKAATTYHPSGTSSQVINAGFYLTGQQTINSVRTSGLLAENIKKDVTIQIGDRDDPSCVASVTGTYEGEGSNNIITGTFNFDSAGTKTISIPYSGSGYPLLIDICVTNVESNTDWKDLIKQSAVEHITLSKTEPSTAPAYAYSGNELTDYTMVVAKYKNSSSDATVYTYGGSNAFVTFTSSAPSASYLGRIIAMPNATSMKVLINYSNYCFAKDIEYTYTIVYSE